ncbi:hypothetical protein BDW62DRAFT_200091 [Aspergillus aurantiobrunneus]
MSRQPPTGYPASFRRLNSQVSLCRDSGPLAGRQPTLIILFPWLSAAPKHVLKYVQLYQEEYPHAQILLVEPLVGDMVWASDAAQLNTLSPAVEVVKSFLDTSSEPGIQFHVFSNAGSHAAVQLVEAYARKYPSTDLPIRALILDSCPGSPSAVLSANAMILALPRNPVIRAVGAILIYIVITVVALFDALGVSENVISKTRRQLNNPRLPFLHPNVRRTYLYSTTDRMVPWGDILQHAKEAREDLDSFNPPDAVQVQTVEFKGSGHVGHLTVDRKRYHDAVFAI